MELKITSLSNTKKTIIENIAKLDTINILSTFCPKFESNKEYTLNNSDRTTLTLIRHIKRMYYHSINFIDLVNESLQNQIKLMQEHENRTKYEIGFPIPDKIYFEFDAVMYSSKSIIGENIHKKILSQYHPSVLGNYKKAAKQFYDQFVRRILDNIRNEVVHLNNAGSSMGSIAHAKIDEQVIEIELMCNYSLNGEKADLKRLFLMITDNMNYIINILMSIMINQVYHVWGRPEKKQSINYGNVIVSVPDFYVNYVEG